MAMMWVKISAMTLCIYYNMAATENDLLKISCLDEEKSYSV